MRLPFFRVQKQHLPASIRHVVPGAFVATLLACLAGAYFYPPVAWLGGGLVACYLLCVALASVVTGAGSEWKLIPVLPLVFPAYHFGYGLGFLRGVLDFVVIRRGPRPPSDKSEIALRNHSFRIPNGYGC